MKLEDIMKEVESYLEINQHDLSNESLKTPNLYGKALRIRSNESMLLRKYSFDLRTLYASKREYYLGQSEPEVYKEKPLHVRVMKSDVEKYITADEDIIALEMKIETQEEKVLYLDNALKQISNRQFSIKSSIDYLKMMNGA